MRRVALCTNSVVVSSIGASLEGRAGLEVVRIDPRSPDAVRRLEDLWPDVAIVDLTTAQSEPISLLRKYPGLLLIGVDLNSNELVVLSGERARPLTMDNLVRVIEAGAYAPERSS
ncbi:MAG: hypothetical protein LAO03_23370 [Acidobacteriia bacterium]|nr:hypothetical protein [Terriglobia bacterium]